MIFNINSTRGQTRFLACVARNLSSENKVASSIKKIFSQHIRLFVQYIYSENTHIYLF